MSCKFLSLTPNFYFWHKEHTREEKLRKWGISHNYYYFFLKAVWKKPSYGRSERLVGLRFRVNPLTNPIKKYLRSLKLLPTTIAWVVNWSSKVGFAWSPCQKPQHLTQSDRILLVPTISNFVISWNLLCPLKSDRWVGYGVCPSLLLNPSTYDHFHRDWEFA